MISDIKQYLSRSTKGRVLVAEIENDAASELRTRRRQLAAELKRLKLRSEREAPALAKRAETARQELARLRAQQEAVRGQLQEVLGAQAQLGLEVERGVQQSEVALRESADPMFMEFAAELSDGLTNMRRSEVGYLGMHLRDFELEGQTLIIRRFIAAQDAVQALQLDPDVPDPHAAVAALRASLAAHASEILDQHGRRQAKERRDVAERRRVAHLVLEQTLAFMKRNGCPAEQLAEYEAEQRKALS